MQLKDIAAKNQNSGNNFIIFISKHRFYFKIMQLRIFQVLYIFPVYFHL